MKNVQLAIITLFFFFSLSHASATTVDVFAEGGYTESSFILRVFTTVNPTTQGPLLSAGVRVLYPPAKLQNPVAIKNDKDWYLGTPENMFPYIAPDTSTPGEVVFLLGKLDQNNPLQGVTGERILLGSVTFDRVSGSALPLGTDFALAPGRDAPFVDFATVTGVDLDSAVTFSSPTIEHSDIIKMRGIIRILEMVSKHDSTTPVRASEMDTNNDGVVGVGEAISLMQELSN